MAANRNSASFEDSFNKKALTHGKALVNQFAILVKLAQMHDIRNEAVEKAAQGLAGTLGVFFEDMKSFSLILIGDYLYIEDVRIKYGVEDFNNFDYLATELKKRKLGTINFGSSLGWPDLIGFVGLFLSVSPASGEPYQDLQRKLSGAGLSGIAIDEAKAAVAIDKVEKITDANVNATKAYIRVVLRIKELFEGIGGGKADIRKLKRAVQNMVDSVYKGEEKLLRLSAIRREESVLPRHYANVCVLSLCIGKRLGLSKYQMARLGMAALLHDVGRQSLPEDLFMGDPDSDEAAWEIIKLHPRLGVQTLLKLKGLNEVAVSAMIVAYEHHRNLDGTGYPALVEPKEQNVFSRIVRVADHYDAATSSGIYGRLAMKPDKALDLMLGRADRYYDREYIEVFARMMGTYPVGTFVLLSDGSPGVVTAPGGPGDGLARPRVMLIGGADAGTEADLRERAPAGNYAREVIQTLDPQVWRVNVYKFLA